MISRFFIDRPVFATVLSIAILLAGLAGMRSLPVEQYPEIVPPQIMVRATYAGASAQTISETVAAPIEQEINGVDGMIYMTTTNDDAGSMRMFVHFDIGTDPDQAAIDVNNRVQAAFPRLPEDVRNRGIIVRKRSGSSLLMFALSSPDGSYDALRMSNYGLLNIIDELKRVPGVGDAALFGAADYSMRVWLQSDKLAQYDLTPGDVARVLREQNTQAAVGAMGSEPAGKGLSFTYTITTEGRFSEPKQFENIILRSYQDGSALLLKDVARIELGAQRYEFTATCNGKPCVPIPIYLQPGANALETADAAQAKMEELAKLFPSGLEYRISYDSTRFVRVSIEEVVETFAVAILLVVIVVFLFLQNARATLIPILAIPVSLVGTFAGMYLFGFSINLLTLFGLILAVGIVVDDAIVVLENVERIMTEEGLPPRQAAIKAMEEVTGPVIAIVLVLVAVFIPVAFLGGLSGVMYRQFAVTIAVSVIISGIVALTLTPALCAIVLQPAHGQPALPFRWFNAFFARITNGYLWAVRFFLGRTVLGILLFLGVIGASALLFSRIPGSLLPNEDQGYVLALTQLPAAASLSRTEAVMGEFTEQVVNNDIVDGISSFTGYDMVSSALKTDAGGSFVMLKHWDERTGPGQDSESFAKWLMKIGATIPEASIFGINPPPIIGISTTGGFEAYMQSSATADPVAIEAAAGKLVAAAGQRPELTKVRTTLNTKVPHYRLQVDRQKTRAMNVPVDAVFEALQATFGSLYVNDFTLFGRNYQVNLQSEAEYRKGTEDLKDVFVRSTDGQMIPVAVLISMERVQTANLLDRFNGIPAAKIMGEPAPGYSSGQALAAMQEVAAQTLSNDFKLGWTGTAYQELKADAGQLAFVFGLLMVFLILAAQYERWSLPLAVVTAVPFAVFGALLAIWLRGLQIDIYYQIGLLVLIGLAAKNAILIVEFAVLARAQGESPRDAALIAARRRFRPIIMTSLAFIMGVIPLALATGAGANARHSIGTGVIGGMLGATLLAIIFVPLFYRLMEQTSSWLIGILSGRKKLLKKNKES